MHNNNKNCSVQRLGLRPLLSVVILLSGVVCGMSLSTLSPSDPHMSLPPLSLSMGKPFGVLVDLDTSKLGSESDPQSDTQTDTVALSSDLIPEDVSDDDVPLSNGYRMVVKAIQSELRDGRPTYALKILTTDPVAKKLKDNEFNRAKALIAQSYLMEGKIDKAAKVAGEAVDQSGEDAPLAGWVAGQAAWRKGDFKTAAEMFAVAAESSVASSWLISGAAYWAARSSARAGDAADAKEWYEAAAQHPRTFYGLISLRVLGKSYDFNWAAPDLGRGVKKSLEQDMKVSAALRLSREGNVSAAITALGATKWMSSDKGRRALLAYVLDKKDPALTLYMARKTRDENGRLYDAALYPESPWEPKSGYQVDKALIHALIRQESRFNPHAVSRTGALGLMQIMPETAEDMMSGGAEALAHPETNMSIGQKYVKQLLRDKSVKNDLFKMAIAYNAGPGNLSRWTAERKHMDDPMLFIESIPSGETRAFVERVMVNYWIYSLRMGKDVPSLDAVAMLDQPDANKVADSRQSLFSDQIAMAE